MNRENNQLVFNVITTIQQPTDAVRKLSSRLCDINSKLIVIGDKKGPESYDIKGVEFLTLQDQLDSKFELARKLPTNHYSRKNIGYLTAIVQGASCIYETDDDNSPLPNWSMRHEKVEAQKFEGSGQKWVNVYKYFSDENIWPRGFPLDEIHSELSETKSLSSEGKSNNSNASPQTPSPSLQAHSSLLHAPIQQGLVNNYPDVDAIWRLVFNKPFDFNSGPSIYLPPQCWCPFNSQSTWWWPVAYPLLYLPSYCSFRMTDIWRSFIAQRCLWELGYGVVFHAPEVIQERNVHNLIKDFKDEIPGYTRNKEFVSILEKLKLDKGDSNVKKNLLKCYDELIRAEFFNKNELEFVNTWFEDLERIGCL